MVGVRAKRQKPDVRIYRLKPVRRIVTIRVDLAAIKKGLKPDFLLQAFDVVEVPEASAFSGQITRDFAERHNWWHDKHDEQCANARALLTSYR